MFLNHHLYLLQKYKITNFYNNYVHKKLFSIYMNIIFKKREKPSKLLKVHHFNYKILTVNFITLFNTIACNISYICWIDFLSAFV